MGERISDEIQKAIESYDYEGEVTKIVHTEITTQISNYFSHFGKGREKIMEAVKGSLNEVFKVEAN